MTAPLMPNEAAAKSRVNPTAKPAAGAGGRGRADSLTGPAGGELSRGFRKLRPGYTATDLDEEGDNRTCGAAAFKLRPLLIC
jgi:hypothetical protein